MSGLQRRQDGVEDVGGEEGRGKVFEGGEAVREKRDADKKFDEGGYVVGVAGFERAQKGLEGGKEVGSGREDIVRNQGYIGFGDFECVTESIAGDRVHREEVYR